MMKNPQVRRAVRPLVLFGVLASAGGCGPTRQAAVKPAPEEPTVRPEAKAAAKPVSPLDGTVRIGLRRASGKPEVPLQVLGAGAVRDVRTGEKLASLAANGPVHVRADYATGQVEVLARGVSVRRPEVSISGPWVKIGRNRYPGTVQFAVDGTGLQLVNVLNVEQYLEGVLPGELPASFGIESQKALAVAARSYVLVQRGKHGEFDLCDGPHCQMYVGRRTENPRAIAAVRATRGQCLWSGDELVYAFYSADCGGISTYGDQVPLKDKPERPLPYLRSVKDAPKGGPDYCARSPYHQWVKRLPVDELEKRLNSEPETYVGRLEGFDVTGYDPTGRIKTVVLRGSEPLTGATAGLIAGAGPPTLAPDRRIVKTVDGWIFRRSVGPRTLKSTLLKVDQPEPGVYRFIGSGYGHGLGLCQIGANGMARTGVGYRRILSHYYPGTRISLLPEPRRDR